MSEEIAIAQNADGFFDLVPTTGFHSLDTSQKIDSLMEVESLAIAERFLELWNKADSKKSIDFIMRIHSMEFPMNYRLEGPLLTKFLKSYG
mgnify:CR=1 FL=1|tara:strand:- start:4463 stop:4735 length:273 start_codon:yes stop_codon:yes gene_type:complete